MKRYRNGLLANENRSRRSRRLRAERLEARLLLAAEVAFVDSGQRLGEYNTFDVALGDLDGDDHIDAFVVDRYTNRVWRNNGGEFTAGWHDPADYSGCRYPDSVALGDLDNDGDLDAFISAGGGLGGCQGNSRANKVWFNNWINEEGESTGELTFVDSGQELGSSSSRGLFLGDLDGDGDLDVFVTGRGHQPANEVWLNDGNGFFTNTGQRLGGYESLDVDLEDLDLDGDLDAFVANSAQYSRGDKAYFVNPDKVWLNDGHGNFTDSGQELLVGSVDSRSSSVSLGDLDDDGDYDAFVADNGAGVPNQVWLNDGNGVFDKGPSVGPDVGAARAIDVSLGDVDGDRDLDAVVANSLDYGSEVWLNNGTGTFDDSGQSLAPDRRSLSVALGDLNDDGYLDIFLGNGTRSSEATSWPDMVYFNVEPSDPEPGITVSPTSGLQTTEAGGAATFDVVLDAPPVDNADVTVGISSGDPSEGATNVTALTFTTENWDTPQQVTVTGVDDADVDGDILYSIVTAAAISDDPGYNGLDPADVTVTNLDNDSATKYFVVDDGVDQTFEYDSEGNILGGETWNLASTGPRGAAASEDGRTLWVIDANKSVYIYDDDGMQLGSWQAGGIKKPQGIATDETDIWIVDSNRIYWYTAAADRMSDTLDPEFFLTLPGGVAAPKGITTDGTSLWIVTDGRSSDEVLKFEISTGDLVGSWSLDSANSKPTGITIDPSGDSNSIWIVDSGTDEVYEYDPDGRFLDRFVLYSANDNPQGIADPPVSHVAEQVTSPAIAVGTTVFREQRTVANRNGVTTPYGKLALLSFSVQGEESQKDRAVDLEIDRSAARPLQFRASQSVPNKVVDRARQETIAELGNQLTPNLDDDLLTTLATERRQS